MVPGQVMAMLERLRRGLAGTDARARLAPDFEALPPRWRTRTRQTAESARGDRTALTISPETRAALAVGEADAQLYGANVENLIGFARVPIGVAGPLRVNGLHASGDFMVPLATTEAALVASYSRGAEAITRSGGAASVLVYDAVLRSPAFVFLDIVDAGHFVDWVVSNVLLLKAAAEETTRHGRLVSVEPLIEGEVVFLLCRYETGDAAGQNMVTIATDALLSAIAAACPVRPLNAYVEGNFSGDKKASHLGLMTGRGRKVHASVFLPDEILTHCLGTTAPAMLEYAKVADLGAKLSGQIGAQGHYANGLAALYIATGQDAACVSESAMGLTRMEPRPGGLFMSVTLPNILVGTVGGGTGLPTQAAGLEILGLSGAGKAPALAEVTAALCLAGEISIMAAIAEGHFSRAHARRARGRTTGGTSEKREPQTGREQ